MGNEPDKACWLLHTFNPQTLEAEVDGSLVRSHSKTQDSQGWGSHTQALRRGTETTVALLVGRGTKLPSENDVSIHRLMLPLLWSETTVCRTSG